MSPVLFVQKGKTPAGQKDWRLEPVDSGMWMDYTTNERVS
jgi:hypothetical protein